MDRLNLETHLIRNIRELPDEKLIELLDFITHLKHHMLPEVSEKSTFLEFIRQSPLYDVELETDRDSSVCRTVEL